MAKCQLCTLLCGRRQPRHRFPEFIHCFLDFIHYSQNGDIGGKRVSSVEQRGRVIGKAHGIDGTGWRGDAAGGGLKAGLRPLKTTQRRSCGNFHEFLSAGFGPA